MDKPVEYEFTLPNGSKRYEIISDHREVFLFQTAIGATSAMPVVRSTSSNFRRRYALASLTVERTAKGWQYCRSGHEKEKGAWSRPYSSIASVTMMVARQLRHEVERRDAPYNVD
jgi:hypothetical protein